MQYNDAMKQLKLQYIVLSFHANHSSQLSMWNNRSNYTQN